MEFACDEPPSRLKKKKVEGFSTANLMKAIPRAGEKIISAGYQLRRAAKEQDSMTSRGGWYKSGVSPRRRPQWQDNHHVCSSLANARLPSQQRNYFDQKPGFHVRCNAYQDLPSCPDCCNQMIWCDYGEGSYSSGWICNNVAICGATASNKGMWRWHCVRCSNDICSKCRCKNVHKQLMTAKLHALVDISHQSSQEVWRSSKAQMTASSPDFYSKIAEASDSAHPSTLNPTQINGATPKKKENRSSALMMVDGQEEFRHYADWCKKTFGGLVQSWRALDGDGNMSISKLEFLKQLSNLGYTGPGGKEAVWKILDRDDSNSLSFQHYCPEAALQLAAFKEWARIKFGDIEGLCKNWNKTRDSKLSMEEFQAGCKKHGLEDEAIISVVFEMYGDKRRGRQPEILIESLKKLHKWECEEYFLAEPDAEGLERLKYELIRRHNGNALKAWRQEIDRDGSMRLNFVEFRNLVRNLQSRKEVEEFNIAGVWRALDANLSDWVSAREFDAKAYDMVLDFKKGATEKFGSCQKFIQQIEKQPVDLNAFVKEVTKAGFCRHAFEEEQPKSDQFEDEFEEAAHALHVKEMYREDCKMLFEGLDVDNSGVVTAHNVRCVDLWNNEEDEAEESAWDHVVQIRMSLHHWVKNARNSVEERKNSVEKTQLA